jgi:cobalt-zinc-cadmium efflux system protein
MEYQLCHGQDCDLNEHDEHDHLGHTHHHH